MTVDLRARSAREVLDDHLRLAAEGRFTEDIERNVAPHCVVLERRGVFRDATVRAPWPGGWPRSCRTPATGMRASAPAFRPGVKARAGRAAKARAVP